MAEELSEVELRRLQFHSRGSTIESRRLNAVCVRHAYKHYGLKSNPVTVLEDLSMTVPKGSIYGLLGASGCGKTTLINCIVGRKRLKSGEIWVLGGAPDTKGSGVPGPRIGFMPQTVSLYGEFTILETMKYFGWITNMTTSEVRERLEFLSQLLQLPNSDMQVKNLSGGQQRRVSFAVTLLHEPELLILDEPTVGLDPILREVIWQHLLELTTHARTTVILTTHYIDETKQATLIGLMRGGYLIAEESPQNLLNYCRSDTLEASFLKLSLLQNQRRPRRSSLVQQVTNVVTVPSGIVNEAVADDVDSDQIPEISGEFGDHVPSRHSSRRASLLSIKETPLPISPPDLKRTTVFDYLLNFNMKRIQALIWKNFMWLLRNLPILMTVLGLPAFSMVIFFVAIGRNPRNLDIALVNYETNNARCNNSVDLCNGTLLSCTYLSYVEKQSFNLIPYDSEYEAIQSVLHGKTYASIVVNQNYSSALKNRLASQEHQDYWDVLYSHIEVFRDVSVKDIAAIIRLHLYKSLKLFLEDYMESCGESARSFMPPIKFHTPIYGVESSDYTEFTTPGLLLALIFFFSLSLTAVVMMAERKDGILERSLVIGVNPVEFLVAHIVVDGIIVIVQVLSVLVVTFPVFNMTAKGSMVLATAFTLLMGFCGMCFGFAISSISDTETAAMALVGGLFIPLVLISGLMWPLEGMHIVLQSIAMVFPFTKANESLRSILQRGWGLCESGVYNGFISMSSWTLFFLLLSGLVLRFRKG